MTMSLSRTFARLWPSVVKGLVYIIILLFQISKNQHEKIISFSAVIPFTVIICL